MIQTFWARTQDTVPLWLHFNLRNICVELLYPQITYTPPHRPHPTKGLVSVSYMVLVTKERYLGLNPDSALSVSSTIRLQ